MSNILCRSLWVVIRDSKTLPGHVQGAISASPTASKRRIRKPGKSFPSFIRGTTAGTTIFVGKATDRIVPFTPIARATATALDFNYVCVTIENL